MRKCIEAFNIDCIDNGITYSLAVDTEDGCRYVFPLGGYLGSDKLYTVVDGIVRDNCEIETNEWLKEEMN